MSDGETQTAGRAAGAALPMRLLAPAGGPEQLAQAIHFGADEVYLAGERWGMRSRSRNFSREELAAAVEAAHGAGVSVHVTLNTLMRDADIDELPDYLHFLNDVGVDAAIVADLGAMGLVRAEAPDVEIHASTQTSIMNARAAEAYARLGARRLVLAREMSLPEVAELRRRVSRELEIEVFAHGSMCMAVSGRCLLSSELVGRERSANFGACTQPCRWGWTLVEESRPDERRMPLESDDQWSYILSSNDLCMLDHLGELADAGVDAIKLEGRAKGSYYTACVTNAYRHVLDGEPAARWASELDAVSHRPYSTGFFFGNPTQNPGRVDYARDRLMVATVERCEAAPDAASDGGGAFVAEVLCRNKARAGETLQVLSAHEPIRECALCGLEHYDADEQSWHPAQELSRAMERYRVLLPFAVEPLDILCLKA